jgi:hypothetical protein
MAIDVKVRCSECATIREVVLNPEERDITCPVCGRRIQNLTDEEHREIETMQKNQKICSIVSVVLMTLTAVCFIMWAGDTTGWVSGKSQEANAGFFFGAIICGLGSLVLGIMASRKRFVVEF